MRDFRIGILVIVVITSVIWTGIFANSNKQPVRIMLQTQRDVINKQALSMWEACDGTREVIMETSDLAGLVITTSCFEEAGMRR